MTQRTRYSSYLRSNGEVLSTTTLLGNKERSKLSKSGNIGCIAVDASWTYIATTGEDKRLKVWKWSDGLDLCSERCVHVRKV